MFLHKALRQTGIDRVTMVFGLLAVLCLPAMALASSGSLTLAWDSNPEKDLAGYRLYYGTKPGSYSVHKDIGLNTTYSLQGLDEGSYYFVVTAYNKSGGESGYSNELEYSVAPPTITNVPNPTSPVAADIAAAQSRAEFTVPGNAAASYSTVGPYNSFQTGYATSTASGAIPYSLAQLSFEQNGVLLSETNYSSSAPTTSTTMLVEHQTHTGTGDSSDIKTGVTIINLGAGDAHLQLVLRGKNGRSLSSKSLDIRQNAHKAEFLDQLFEIPGDFGLGTLEVHSDQPVSVFPLRLTMEESGGMLLSTPPVVDKTKPATSGSVYFPQMSFGGGYRTDLQFFNNSDQEQSGNVYLRTVSGIPMGPPIPYRIVPGGVYQMGSADAYPVLQYGWMEVVPDKGSAIPAAAARISLRSDGKLVSESYLFPGPPISHAYVYVDESNGNENLLTIANPGSSQARVTIRAVQANTQPVKNSSELKIAAESAASNNVMGLFRNSLPDAFKGFLELTSADSFVLSTLRKTTNVQGKTILSYVPSFIPGIAPATPVVFAQIADGSGFRTEFIFLNSRDDATVIQLNFWDEKGNLMEVGKP